VFTTFAEPFSVLTNLLSSIPGKLKNIRGDGRHLIMSNGVTLNVAKQLKEDFLHIYSSS